MQIICWGVQMDDVLLLILALIKAQHEPVTNSHPRVNKGSRSNPKQGQIICNRLHC